MSRVTLEQFHKLLPLACAWAAKQEAVILRHGERLTPDQIEDARMAGVVRPQHVRLLPVPSIPIPEHSGLQAAVEAAGLISPQTTGLSFRYGIFIRSDCWGDRRLVIRELAHTAEYERLGGIRPFLESHLFECLTRGCAGAPMERAAVEMQHRLLGG